MLSCSLLSFKEGRFMAWIQERKTKDGKTRYRAVIRVKGFPVECATFPNKTKAQLWIKHTESAIAEGRYFQTSEAKKHTLKELIERYEKAHKEKIAKSKQAALLLWWKQELGDRLLSSITPALITEHKEKLLQGMTAKGTVRSNATTVRYLAAISHVFRIAVNDYGWMNENPVLKVEKPKEPRGRIRFLDADERKRLLEACQLSTNPYLYTIVILALSTGMRQGEIMNLTWKNIDLSKKRITLFETKNGEIRVLPLSGPALDLITKLTQEKKVISELLFPGKSKNKPIDIRSSWRYAIKRAQIKGFRFHDCRHSTGSYLAMNGASIAEIAEVLGHKTLMMVKRYAHLSESHITGVLEKMNDKIFG